MHSSEVQERFQQMREHRRDELREKVKVSNQIASYVSHEARKSNLDDRANNEEQNKKLNELNREHGIGKTEFCIANKLFKSDFAMSHMGHTEEHFTLEGGQKAVFQDEKLTINPYPSSERRFNRAKSNRVFEQKFPSDVYAENYERIFGKEGKR